MVGQYWLFADSDCPVLQTLLLAVSTTVAWIVMSLSAIMGRNISPLSHMQRVAGVFACGLLVPVIFGTAFFQFPELRAQICPTCEKYIESARDLRIAAENDPNPLGKLEGAEYHARMAKKTCGPRMRTNAMDILASVLFDKGGALVSRGNCPDSKKALDEAKSLATEHGL